jgi:phosphohistidine phosphatase
MKTIILMRHAQASHSSDSERDFDRQLTAEGRNVATRTAVALNHAGIRLDRIVCSAAVRTCQTADIVASVAEFFGPTDALEELYLAESFQIAASAAQQCASDDQTLLIVGHNPGVAALIGRLSETVYPVPPSTAAVFEVQIVDWSEFYDDSKHPCSLQKMIRDGETIV